MPKKKPSSQWVKGKQSVFILNEGNLTNLHYPHVDMCLGMAQYIYPPGN